jgi:hypothetical protein
MSTDTIAQRRRIHQQIAMPTLHDPVQAVAHMGVMQGQDYAGVRWSAALRTQAATLAEVDRAFDDMRLVRTWLMRGTLHICTASDVRWLIDLYGARILAAGARRRQQIGLDDDTLQRAEALICEALADGQRLPRSSLFARLEAHGISTAQGHGYHTMTAVSYRGVVAQATADRNDPLFFALDDHIAPAPMRTREEVLTDLARRYFTTRGPATVHDFAAWADLPMADARAGLEGARPALASEVVGKRTLFAPTGTPVMAASPSLDLLPGFDEFLLGYRDRSDVLDPMWADRIVPGGNGVFRPTIVLNGLVVGTWKVTLRRTTAILTLTPFASETALPPDLVDAAAARYSEFLEMPVKLA